MQSVSVVIPVYKKLNEFAIYIRNNIHYLEDCEIIIVNDDPSTHLPEQLPAIKDIDREMTWINNQDNLGFSRSVNAGAREATGEFLLLLNSDVKLLDNSWRHVVPEFTDDPNLFAVGFAQKERDGSIVGRNELYFKNGLFHHRTLPFDTVLSTQHSALLSTAWAEGGSAVIRKSMWDELKGFDEAYSPFYWEDVDLSYRARQRGWQILFAPEIIIEHHHESTIGSEYTKQQITAIAFRNQLYFTSNYAKGFQRIEYLIFKYLLLRLRNIRNVALT